MRPDLCRLLRSLVLTFLALSAVFAGAAPAQDEPVPVGAEFQVNTYTTFDQRTPDIDMRADGSFVVVWQNRDFPTTDYQIRGRIFDSAGDAVGDDFRIDGSAGGYVFSPKVATEDDGGFVVSWGAQYPPGDDIHYGVVARRFDASGTALAPEFQVNETTNYISYGPNLDVDADGRFVVVWDGRDPSGDVDGGVFGRLFAADGTPEPEFTVNDYTTGKQRGAEVAFDADGEFKIVWTSDGSAGSDLDEDSVQERNFFADGQPGSAGQVNSTTSGSQRFPSVAFSTLDRSAVTWTSSQTTDDPTEGIQGLVRDRLGLGTNIRKLHETTPGTQTHSSVAGSPDGYFAVSWQSGSSAGTDTDFWSVQGRLLRPDGSFLGGEFQVNTFTGARQAYPQVAAGPGGRFAIVWNTEDPAGDDVDTAVSLQLFHFGDLFADGFESGDAAAWSAAVD